MSDEISTKSGGLNEWISYNDLPDRWNGEGFIFLCEDTYRAIRINLRLTKKQSLEVMLEVDEDLTDFYRRKRPYGKAEHESE